MSNNKSKQYAIVYVVGAILALVALAIFISVRLSAGPKPIISSVYTEESTIYVVAEDESLNLVYCAAKTPSPSSCEWEDSHKLKPTTEGTYYIFIKNIDTGSISSPETFEYALSNLEEE